MWAATQVVRRDDVEHRALMIQHVLKIATMCRKRNNFHACFALYAGLSISSVDRLKKSWKKINAKARARRDQLAALFAPDKNHQSYQQAVREATPPVVPYIAITSKQLFAIEDANPTTMENGMLNLQKLRMLYKLQKQFKAYKKGLEGFVLGSITSHYQYFNSALDVLSEDKLYELSLKREPRK